MPNIRPTAHGTLTEDWLGILAKEHEDGVIHGLNPQADSILLGAAALLFGKTHGRIPKANPGHFHGLKGEARLDYLRGCLCEMYQSLSLPPFRPSCVGAVRGCKWAQGLFPLTPHPPFIETICMRLSRDGRWRPLSLRTSGPSN
jgi:hypothetical protein